ncbi:MAG: hypothetical protein U0939_00850 [Pirellulales bacterium]
MDPNSVPPARPAPPPRPTPPPGAAHASAGSAASTAPTATAGRPLIAWLFDGALALGLGGMLLAVYVFDLATSHWFREPPPAIADSGLATEKPLPVAPVKRLRLAVSPHQFDDMGRMLSALGEGYRYDDLPLAELVNLETLQRYDVVFLTCGGTPDEWQQERSRGREDLKRSLRSYVEQGGTLYASDWRLQLLQIAFPELIDANRLVTGNAQEMTADVVDEGLREAIGETIHLRFDLGGWYPAAFQGREVQTYLRGSYSGSDGSRPQSPLLVKIPVGRGAIIFTSFHNEKQNSATELELLKYLVFTTVTARAQEEANQTIVKGGFSPAKQNLLSTSKQSPSVTKTYQHSKAGPLVFVLAFENQGAKLRLEVTGPDGKTQRKEGTQTLQIEMPDAAVGAWKYTVTAVEVPFENFPYSVTVGQKSP